MIKLDENDEKHLLLMLLNIDPNALERLISGDVPDLKSMQPHMTVDRITVCVLCTMAFIALGSAYLLKRSEFVTRNARERDEEGQRVKGGGKKKGRRKKMRGAEEADRK